MDTHDCIVIGAGPAGLSVAASLQQEGIQTLVIEREHVGYNVSRFPVCMRFFSSRDLVELNDFSLTIPDEKPTREQYLAYLYHFVLRKQISVLDYTTVTGVSLADNLFRVELRNLKEETSTLYSKSVVVALGALDHPQMLNVEGESLPHVTHYFQEVFPYIGHKTLVVGSGNGAVETALLLYRAGANVALSYRDSALNAKRIKYWLYPDIAKRLEKNQIEHLNETEVIKIEPNKVFFKSGEKEFFKEFDFVIAQTGYEPPVAFLNAMGIEIDPETKIPRHEQNTLETNIPGLFIAGAIVGGNVSGKVFIENSRFHGAQILKGIRKYL